MTAAALGFTRLALTHYAVVIALFLAAYGLGRRILRSVKFDNGYEEVSFSAGLGLGIFAQSVFLLGLIHLIYPAVTLLLLAGGVAFGWKQIRDGWSRLRLAVRSANWIARAVGALLILVILLLAVLPLYPPYSWDALSYHLPSARIYARSHAVHPTPYLRFCVFPQLNEMLYTLVLTFSDAVSSQAVEFLLFLLTGAAIAGAAMRIDRRAVLPAILAWVGIPEVVLLGSQDYIDVGLALYVTLFIFAAWNWLRDRRQDWLVLAAIYGGFAASIKYTALFVLACFGIALCVWSVRERNPRRVAIFCIVVALLAGPWYAYIYYHTGNPLFPFLSTIFGTGCWSANDVALVYRDLGHFGTGRTLQSFVTLPWNLAFRQSKFHIESPVSPILFAGIPIWILGGIASRRTRFPASMTCAFFLFWFFTVQEPRYLMPILPTMCLLLGHVGAMIGRRMGAAGGGVFLLIVAGIAGAPGIKFAWLRIGLFGPPPINAEQTENFFHGHQTYECYRWLNARYGQDYVLYAFDVPYMNYFADGTRIGDVLGPGRVQDVPAASGRGLKSALDKFGAQFVLFSSDPVYFREPPQDAYFHSYFAPVARCSAGTVWKVSPVPVREQKGEELITNGGFENRDPGWAVGGDVSFESTGRASHSGKVAACVNPNSIPLSQSIRTWPNQNYELTFFYRGEGDGAKIRFVVSWFDRANRDLRDDVQIAPAGPNWHSESLTLAAPEGASSATIYPESIGGRVCYDDVSLREVSYVPTTAPAAREGQTIFGVYRPGDRRFFIRHQLSEGFADEVLDAPADGLPVAGNWEGDGHLEAGIYDPGTGVFRLLGRKPRVISMKAHALPIAGDWNGQGTATVGVYDPQQARFDLYDEKKPTTFIFGEPGDLPISGDWNGDGVTTIGVYRPSNATFYLRNSNTAGPPDRVVRYGTGKEIPIAGDWNLDGKASPGLFDPHDAVFRLRNENGSETVIRYGIAGDRPFVASHR